MDRAEHARGGRAIGQPFIIAAMIDAAEIGRDNRA